MSGRAWPERIGHECECHQGKQYGVNVGDRSSIVISRYGNTLIQFVKFGLVGGSGVIVNMAVLVVANKLFGWGLDVTPHDTVMNILGTRFNLRWYHIFATIAFVVANTWNFQSNQLYCAYLIGIVVAMPVNFIVNKLWTFKAVRGSRVSEMDASVVER